MDTTAQEETKAHLMQTNDNFRQLMEKHHEYDRLVAALEIKHAPTAADQVEEHRLKKLKLHLKDEMEQMVSGYRLQTR